MYLSVILFILCFLKLSISSRFWKNLQNQIIEILYYSKDIFGLLLLNYLVIKHQQKEFTRYIVYIAFP